MARDSDDPPRIAVVGSYNHDLSVTVPSIPVPGETVLGEDFEATPGGKGSNQAIAAARTGGDVAFIGAVGDDRFGEAARDLWKREDIDASGVRTTEPPTGVALIHIAESGENAIAVARGANHELAADDVRTAALEASDVLLTQLETPVESVAAAVKAASDAGAEVILDPAPARELPAEVLEATDVVTPNESELRILAGYDPDAEVKEEAVAHELLERGPSVVVVTLGDSGALVVTDDRTATIAPVPAEVVDTTGAGDAFNGAFGVARGEGEDVVTATEWGVTAGALACEERGVVPSLPERDALDARRDAAGRSD
ncbi:MAG: ribokinase [Natronomonas sp.]|jgi:ribokinase|uniref:ribokinase n=1 Tax=Natronomonas sp. TaxID=2184060 RepID=UPI0039899DD7